MEIILKDLPKVSLNKIYSGVHWKVRSDLKNDYYYLIKAQCKTVFSKSKIYHVNYTFGFKSSPFDTINTALMAKLIEDVLFIDDTFRIIPKITLESKLAKENYVKIEIKELWDNSLF